MNDKNVNSKIAFFKEKNTKVHIDCSNRFYNGFILDVEPGKEFLYSGGGGGKARCGTA